MTKLTKACCTVLTATTDFVLRLAQSDSVNKTKQNNKVMNNKKGAGLPFIRTKIFFIDETGQF